MADAPDPQVYEQLARAHHTLEEQLGALARHSHLSPRDQLEAAALKKRKLALKDRMAALRATSGSSSTQH